MTNLVFLHPERVHLLWLALVLVALLAWLDLRGEQVLARFVSTTMQARLAVRARPARRLVRWAFVLLAITAGVLALMRPQASRAAAETSATTVSADIMVLLDTSRSMLAEDAAPNRLERAKAELRDLVGELRGSRLGLIAFAGRAAVLCPLTLDHGFFRLVLNTVNTASAGRGGTRIGDAIRKAVAGFPAGSESSKVILLITDGEDHDSYPLDAAKQALAAGVRIVAIGFGDEKGSEITLVDPKTGARSTLVDRAGNVVRSRLDGETLRTIAHTTEGAYIPAGVAALDMRSIVAQHLRPMMRNTPTTRLKVVQAERYPWFVLAALLALLAAVWTAAVPGQEAAMRRVVPLLAVLALAAPLQPARSDENEAPRRSYNRAMEALAKGDLEAAEKGFGAARDRAGQDGELRFRAAFNLGFTYAKKAEGLAGQKPEAAMEALVRGVGWLRDAVHQRPGDADARVNLELVLRRARALADKVNQGENGLAARLERLIEEQRGLRDQARGLVARVAQAGAGVDAMAFHEPFREAATLERTLISDAGTVAELAGQESDQLKSKPEEQRSDEERARLVQLGNLGFYLEPARQLMGNARHLFSQLQGEKAHGEADAALRSLKRAREQLQDPVTVLKGLAEDELVLGLHAAQLVEARQPRAIDAPAAAKAPAWLTPNGLASGQDDVGERTNELLARLRAGIAHAQASAGDGGAPVSSAPAQGNERQKQRVVQAAGEAVPLLDEAKTIMSGVALALRGDRLAAARDDAMRALALLLRAMERFSGTRDLIELAYADQKEVVDLLTNPKAGAAGAQAKSLSEKERGEQLVRAVARNRERMDRLAAMFADEVAALDEKTAQAQKQQPQAQGGQGAKPEDPSAGERERYRQAEEERQAGAGELARLAGALTARAKPALMSTPARAALERIEALRRLFFSIVEHLKELAERQGETHDRTSSAAAISDEDERRQAAAPLGEAETRHAAMAEAIANALREQSEKATASPPSQGQGAARPGAPSPEETARILEQASTEVTSGAASMRGAAGGLAEAAQPSGMSYDLAPTLEQQKNALEHLAKAIALLSPPPQQQQQQDKQQKQDQQDQASREQASRRLQDLRDREAERLRNRQQHAPPEPVDKDW